MRRICGWVLLCCMACQDDVVPMGSSGMAGEWEIQWTLDEENATGVLYLGDDHSGEILADNPVNSALLPGSHKVCITWERTKGLLKLVRMDNNFEMDYTIVEDTGSSLLLTYTDDIRIVLNRLDK